MLHAEHSYNIVLTASKGLPVEPRVSETNHMQTSQPLCLLLCSLLPRSWLQSWLTSLDMFPQNVASKSLSFKAAFDAHFQFTH